MQRYFSDVEDMSSNSYCKRIVHKAYLSAINIKIYVFLNNYFQLNGLGIKFMIDTWFNTIM